MAISKESVNQDVYDKTAQMCKVSPKQVEEFFRVTCAFTEETIRRGGFETVMWPSFGKFKVKPKQIQFLAAQGLLK